MPRVLRVATRGSELARLQAGRVAALLGGDVELVIVSTVGDQRTDVPIHTIGGTGVFVKEVQQAVLDGRANLAVHSAKDLPASPGPDGIVLAAVPERVDPRDALVGSTLDGLGPGARIGTGSVRRRAQLAARRPDLTFGELRGNIPKRLERAGEFDAIVVAVAALERLDLIDRVTEILEPSVMLPQVGQGALAVECRTDDAETRERLAAIDDTMAHAAVGAERAFLAQLGGGCDLPCGTLARIDAGLVVVDALLASLDGRIVLRATGRAASPLTAGTDAADDLFAHGGRTLLDDSSGDPRSDTVTVALVGAGPGDPGLITVRGAELLSRADVVVYDRLASASLLALAPAHAELVPAGKAPGRVDLTQDEINRVLVERGLTGAAVVRLKGGDPFVFGRGGEEAEALAAAGVPFEVVPGITSAIGAATYAGIPVTHRGVSTHFTVVTGHEDPAKARTDVDWDALARVGGTLVILMGAGRIDEIAKRLVAGGRPPETPVAVVRNGTRLDQRSVRASLATVSELDVQAPSAIVVGEVAALDLAWFEARPLFGRSVVVTRAREQASNVRAQLEALGAEVIELPTIATEPVAIVVPDLRAYEWLVFTSATGVAAFFDRGLAVAELDARALAGVRIAAIGPGTAAALTASGLRPDLVPEQFVAESLLEAFPPPSTPGARVLLARAEQARDVLPDGLTERGYTVDILAVYRTVRAEPPAATVARVRAGEVDAITFTSSSTVDRLYEILGGVPDPQPVVVSIGPVTSESAHARGFRVDDEAAEHTVAGIVTTLLSRFGVTERRSDTGN